MLKLTKESRKTKERKDRDVTARNVTLEPNPRKEGPALKFSFPCLGNGWITVSRVLFRKRELNELCGKLGESCEKLGEVALAPK